ncbi:MAG: hypothetical protein FWG13_08275 [Leptospirales bacterium]|nr:hypothetical protein [Leptospirales bacterium]
MKINCLTVILFGVSLIFISCSKSKGEGEAEVRAVINEMRDELIEYEKNMTRAANAQEVANEIRRHSRKMVKFANALKMLGEKYPDLNNEKYTKSRINDALIEEVNSNVDPVLDKYGGEPEIAGVYAEILKEMQQTDPTVSDE